MSLCQWLLFGFCVQVLGECPHPCKCSRHLHILRCQNFSLIEVPLLVPSVQVTVLDLSLNNLTKLKNDTFLEKNIINVSVIKLNDNNITTVEIGAFRGLSESLLDLQLSNNPHLKLPDVGFNLEALLSLDLTACGLERIPMSFFQGMPDITDLYLRANKLSFFDPDIIKPGKGLELTFLSLEDNQFTKLQLRLVVYQKTNLLIDGNPFHCDCDFFLAYSVYSIRPVSPYAPPVCATPEHLHDVTGPDLLKMNLQCDKSRLNPELQEMNTWWYQHQWWILSVGALGVVGVAVLVHYAIKYNRRCSIVERLWPSRKFTAFENRLNESESVNGFM